jgi:hypothetical protein
VVSTATPVTSQQRGNCERLGKELLRSVDVKVSGAEDSEKQEDGAALLAKENSVRGWNWMFEFYSDWPRTGLSRI